MVLVKYLTQTFGVVMYDLLCLREWERTIYLTENLYLIPTVCKIFLDNNNYELQVRLVSHLVGWRTSMISDLTQKKKTIIGCNLAKLGMKITKPTLLISVFWFFIWKICTSCILLNWTSSCRGNRRASAWRSYGFGPLEPLLVSTLSSYPLSLS